jgi:flagellar basal body-associated protein FliL
MADDKKEEIEEKSLDTGEQAAPSEPEVILPPKGLRKYLGFLSFIPRFYTQHKLLSIILGIILILAIAGGAAVYFLFLRTPANAPQETAIQYNASYYPLPELKLSVKKDEENLSYLVIGLTLKLPEGLKPENFHKKEPEILDALHTYFSSITLDSLGSSPSKSLVSPVGLERLRQNLIRRLNTVLAPLKIESILFRKLITQ